MPTYGTFSYTDFLSQITDRFVNKEIKETSVFKTVALEKFWRSKQPITGSRIEFLTVQGNPGNAKTFSTYSTNDGYTAVEPSNHSVCQTSMKYVGAALKLSGIKIGEASGKEAMADYTKQQVRQVIIDVKQKINDLYYNGNPTSDATEPWGFRTLIDYTGAAYGVNREDARSLVGNKLNAGSATASDTAKTISVTKGSQSATMSANITCAAGDLFKITDSNGKQRVYYAETAVSADTAVTLMPAYEGATESGLTCEYVSPFIPTGTYGSANAFDLAKVNRALALATDGNEAPDCALMHQFVHERFQDEILAVERAISVSDKTNLGMQSATGFRYRTMLSEIDNNCNSTELLGLNSNYIETKAAKRFNEIALAGGRLKEESSSTANAFQNLLGEIVVGFEITMPAINRQFLITGLNN